MEVRDYDISHTGLKFDIVTCYLNPHSLSLLLHLMDGSLWGLAEKTRKALSALPGTCGCSVKSDSK